MHTRNITIGRQTISIETGRLAKQADGAVVVRSGDTMVLVTAQAAANPREGIDFLPLTVDYREYTYASGRIPGGWRHEAQIFVFNDTATTENDSDVLAITGASAALAISSVPFTRSIAGVRVGLVEGEFLINPTFEQRRKSKLDLIVAGS